LKKTRYFLALQSRRNVNFIRHTQTGKNIERDTSVILESMSDADGLFAGNSKLDSTTTSRDII